jgi:hypothetical protein
MKRIGIIGTRRRDTPSVRKLIEEQFWKIYEKGDIICSGGCPKGGDRFAESIARAEGIPILTIYPNFKKYGQGAPKIRNTPVAQASDIIIACVVNPEDPIEEILKRTKGGTEDTLRKFVAKEEHNINKVVIV